MSDRRYNRDEGRGRDPRNPRWNTWGESDSDSRGYEADRSFHATGEDYSSGGQVRHQLPASRSRRDARQRHGTESRHHYEDVPLRRSTSGTDTQSARFRRARSPEVEQDVDYGHSSTGPPLSKRRRESGESSHRPSHRESRSQSARGRPSYHQSPGLEQRFSSSSAFEQYYERSRSRTRSPESRQQSRESSGHIEQGGPRLPPQPAKPALSRRSSSSASKRSKR